jgi:hypothetical protein
MQVLEGTSPDKCTYVQNMLNACGVSLRAVEDGKSAHVQIIQSGCESDVFMGSSLINMYAKYGSMEEALKDACT